MKTATLYALLAVLAVVVTGPALGVQAETGSGTSSGDPGATNPDTTTSEGSSTTTTTARNSNAPGIITGIAKDQILKDDGAPFTSASVVGYNKAGENARPFNGMRVGEFRRMGPSMYELNDRISQLEAEVAYLASKVDPNAPTMGVQPMPGPVRLVEPMGNYQPRGMAALSPRIANPNVQPALALDPVENPANKSDNDVDQEVEEGTAPKDTAPKDTAPKDTAPKDTEPKPKDTEPKPTEAAGKPGDKTIGLAPLL